MTIDINALVSAIDHLCYLLASVSGDDADAENDRADLTYAIAALEDYKRKVTP